MGYSWNHEQYSDTSFFEVGSTWGQLFGHLHNRLGINLDVVTTGAGPIAVDAYWQFHVDNGSQADQQRAPILIVCPELDGFGIHALVDSLASADAAMFHAWSNGE